MLPAAWGGQHEIVEVAKRSIYFGGRKTSATLEEAFWQGLREIAHQSPDDDGGLGRGDRRTAPAE